jgi:hypothetical protein
MRISSSHRSRAILGGLIVAAALWVPACGANMAPVLNVNHAPVAGAPAGADPAASVRDAIHRAILSRGWTVAGETPGVLTATIQKDGISATVDIPYTATDYSIVYRDSAGLKYDGNRIHKRYNHWVDRLQASITAELTKPSTPAAAGAPAPAGTPAPGTATPAGYPARAIP